MMDCVMPTRNGRNGMLFTSEGIMNMRNKKWADDFSPIQEVARAMSTGNTPKHICGICSYLRNFWLCR